MPSKPRHSARCAFVLGNSDYRHAGKLANPLHDVTAIAAELKRIGYDVFGCENGRTLQNLDRHNIMLRFDEFLAEKVDVEAGGAEIVLLYYSGHGLQLPDDEGNIINYIVPIDFTFDCEKPVLRLVSVQDLIERIGPRNCIVFLDACRNTGGLAFGADSGRTRARVRREFESADPGLAVRGIGAPEFVTLKRKPLVERTFIAYAAESGQEAFDAEQDSPHNLSPFTRAVARYIGVRGLDLNDLSQLVANDVRQITKGEQVPWISSNLLDTSYIHNPETRPRWLMGAAGAVVGAITGVFAFKCVDLQNAFHAEHPKLANVVDEPIVLLTTALMGLVVGLGAWRWGRKTPDMLLGAMTAIVYTAAASIVWYMFASFLSDDTMGNIYDGIGKGKFGSSFFFEKVGPDETHVIWRILALVTLAGALCGTASVAASQLFVRSLRSVPRLAVGFFIGAAIAACILGYLLVQAEYVRMHGELNPGLQIIVIVALAAAWCGCLAFNVGWAYSTNVAKPQPLSTVEVPRWRRWYGRLIS